ncbi:MAG: condensation domain-containing protein [Saprospiraceae bacterium]|nr:AMP-binding protein [Lewinella sp.]
MMKLSDLVIVEMACRFPGANTPDGFWQCLIEQTDVFQSGNYSRTQIDIDGNIQTKTRSEVSDVFAFDPTGFSLSEEELLYTDPQQRLLLEMVSQIFTNTNFTKTNRQRNVGVFVGVAHNSYLDTVNARFFEESFLARIAKDELLYEFSLEERQKIDAILRAQLSSMPRQSNMIAGNLMNLIPNRISHEFNLKGPSMAIETACSSSLVAFHAACESIRNGECESAIAAGVQLNLTPIVNYYMEAAGAVSAKGRLTAFDETADGIILGEGAGAVLVKKYEDAVEAGDNILCTVRASGVNNDGRSMGVLAPNLKGQIALIREVYRKNAINPQDIYAIEAHGTGTKIGDAVEINTLKSIFDKRSQPLFVTAVKSNIGHLLGAAGIASLIKTVLCLNKKMVPANMGLSSIPAKWELEKYPIDLIKENKVIDGTAPVLIGINSFGFGGTNCHCVLSDENIRSVRTAVSQKLNKRRYQFNAPPSKVLIYKPTYVPVKLESIGSTMAGNGVLITDDPESSLLLTAITWPIFTDANISESQMRSADSVIFHYHHSLNEAGQIVKHVLKIRQIANTPGINRISLILEGIDDTGFGKLLFTLFTGLGQEMGHLKFGILTVDSDFDSLQKAAEIFRQPPEGIITIKKGQTVARNYENIELPHSPSDNTDSGHTLIVSGSSGIGLECSAYLSGKDEKVISIGRRSKHEVLKIYEQRKINPANIEYFSVDFLQWKEVLELARLLKEKKISLSTCIFTLGEPVVPSSLVQQEEKYITGQITSKVAGIENLRKLLTLLDQDPEVFLFSSTSAVVASEQRGILDYAMANAYLEGVACEYGYRVIHWGPWYNTGQARQSHHGTNSITTALALQCWESIAVSDERSVLVQADQSYASSVIVAEASEKEPTHAIHLHHKNGSSHDPIRIDREKLKAFLVSELNALIGEELQWDELDTPLENLGLDSLDAVDLARKMETAFGINLEATTFFEYNTINKIISFLGGKEASEQFKLPASQKNFLTAQLIEPDSPNNILLLVKFRENIESMKLQQAIRSVLNSIGELKLNFHLAVDREAYGVLREFNFDITVSQGSNYRDFVAACKKKINTLFSLQDEPLLQIYLQEYQNQANAMLLLAHHILLDGWSLIKLFDEIFNRYRNPVLPEEAPVTFKLPDYIAVVKYNGDPENNLNYWRQTLKGYRGLQLPHDGRKDGAIKIMQTTVCEAELLQLKSLAQENNCSLFEILLSIYFFTIHQLVKADDLIIGIANANRNRSVPGAFEQIGSLANSIPVRIDLSRVSTGRELIAMVKSELKAALKHAAIDSALLKNIAELDQAENNARLSPFGMSYINLDKRSVYKDYVEEVSAHTTLSFVDLTLLCSQYSDKLELSWTYNEARFSDRTAERFVQTFSETMAELIGLKSFLKIQSKDEIHELQMPSVDLFAGIPLVHDKVFAACQKYSSRVAIEQKGRSVTYNDLLSSVDEASRLISQLPASVPLVGILGFPAISSTISILSIMRSGRAYLPLDPSWPAARIELLLKESGARALCVGSEQLELIGKLNFSSTSIQYIFRIDQGDCQILQGDLLHNDDDPENMIVRIEEDDLAYVMYTSGTTGVPKGVIVSHRSLSIFLNWLQETFEFSENDRFLATSSLGFGGSLRQLFSTLLSGGTYIPMEPGLLQDPERAIHFIVEQKITIINTVPSVWESLADRCLKGGAKPEHLRLMLIGGEKMPVGGLKHWREVGTKAKIYNLYGSTETVVNATYFDTSEFETEGAIQVPIGQTRRGVVVLIVDENDQLCPVGKVGRIMVGGPGISAGYFNEVGTTEQKYRYIGQTRFYDTGDFGYQDLHHNYHFEGRKDNQIKIFGNRIDPAEIEICITQVAGINNVKVLGVAFDQTTYLVAFIITDKPLEDITEQLKEMVKRELPGYMTPHYIFKIEKIPLNQAKKVDFRALHELAMKYIHDRMDTTSSASLDVEEVVREKWNEIFDTDDIGIDDDFFAIGGDSLNAYLLSVLLQDALGDTVPPHMVYRYPTIRSLSRQLKERPTMEMGEVYRGDHNKLTNSERGFMLVQKISGRTPVCCARIRMMDQLDIRLFKQAFNLVIEKHPILRSVFFRKGSEILLEAVSVHEYDIEYQQYRGDQPFEDHLMDRFEQMKRSEFAPDSWPLFKLTILEDPQGEKHLLAAMHHLIIDAWSLEILFSEINTLYYTLLIDQSTKIAPLDAIYQEARHRIHQRENTERPEAVKFWADQLKDIPFKPERIEEEMAIRDKLTLKINTAKTEQLRVIAQSNRTSLFIVILWIWTKTLEKTSEEDSFLMGISQSGREFLGRNGEELIGCFATGIPFPYKSSREKDLSFHDQLKQIAKELSNCVEHNLYSLRALAEINSGNPDAGLLNFAYFLSFLDHQSMKAANDRSILVREEMDLYFRAETGSAKLMASISADKDLVLQLLGYGSNELKKRCLEQFDQVVDDLLDQNLSQAVIDSALIAYLPTKSRLSNIPKLLLSEIERCFFSSGSPLLVEKTQTKFGTSGLIVLPIYADDLMNTPKDEIKKLTLEAIALASGLGAKVVSLAGNLPTLLNYGYQLKNELAAINTVITTGHAATVVAVVLNTLQALRQTHSRFCDSRFAVVGFGSIGRASLEMLLRLEGGPETLCVYELATKVSSIKNEVLRIAKQYNREIRIMEVDAGKMPDSIYKNDLIVVAATSPEILDVSKIRPGTIVVDDSFPGAMTQNEAIDRMSNTGDVLLIGGGRIDFPNVETAISNLQLNQAIETKLISVLTGSGLPGCRAESILLSAAPELPATLGLVDVKTVETFYSYCIKNGIGAQKLSIDHFTIGNKTISNVGRIRKNGYE